MCVDCHIHKFRLLFCTAILPDTPTSKGAKAIHVRHFWSVWDQSPRFYPKHKRIWEAWKAVRDYQTPNIASNRKYSHTPHCFFLGTQRLVEKLTSPTKPRKSYWATIWTPQGGTKTTEWETENNAIKPTFKRWQRALPTHAHVREG